MLRRLARLLRLALLATVAAWPHLGPDEIGSWGSPAAVRAEVPALLPVSRTPGVVRLPDGWSSAGPALLPSPPAFTASAQPIAAGSGTAVLASPGSLCTGCPRFPTGPPPTPPLA